MQSRLLQILICLCLSFVLAACAGLQQPVTAEGEKAITMEASSFKFTPNNIKTYQGIEITLRITNVSGSAHDFTLKNPQGQVIKKVDLPANRTVEFRVSLPDVGEYDFYCDKPFHSSFGMRGRIEAVRK